MVERNLFVPILPVGSPSRPGNAKSIDYLGRTDNLAPVYNEIPNNKQQNKPMIEQLGNAALKGYEMYSNLPPDVQTSIKEGVSRKFSGSPTNGGGTRKHSSGFTLSKAPDPMVTNLDSGIEPNAYVSDVMRAEENKCAPLHISCNVLQFPTSTTNFIYDYIIKNVVFEIQTRAQENVGFNLNINTDFTDVKIFAALNSVLKALQVYYWFASIITYHSYFGNNNQGMIALRTAITPTMLEYLSQLGRRLADTPIPPQLLELVRYLSANYYSGDNQGASMIKICPCPGTNANSLLDVTTLTAALTDLSSSNNNQVFTLLRRSVPHWKPGPLKDVEVLTKFDKNFLTIFANLPTVTTNAGFTNFPVVAATTDNIAYNAFTNTLDGVAYSLTAMYLTGTGWLPSLIIPITAAGDANSRKSYYTVSGTIGFYNSDDPILSFLSRARPDTNQLNDARTALYSMHLSGADKVLGVSADTIRETTKKVLNYLMSLDTIRSAKAMMPGRSNPSSNPVHKTSRKRRGK